MFQCIIQQRNGWIHAPNPEMRDVFPDIRLQLNEQLRCLDVRVEAQVSLIQELQDFFRRRSEVELDYSKNMDKLAKSLLLRHKEQKQKREQWPLFSSYACWQQMINHTKSLSKDHAILSDVYSNHLVTRFQSVIDDIQRIYKRCREIGYETHEEILRVLQELHTTMKTYHSYQTECKAAEAKLRTAENQRTKLQQTIPKEKLERSKKYRLIEKEVLKRRNKYTDARLKALKAKNEYQLCLEASNTTIHKYFVEDLSDLIDCMDLGFHSVVSRALLMHVTADQGRCRSMLTNAENLSHIVHSMDSRADKQKFLEQHHGAFMIPKRLEFQGQHLVESIEPELQKALHQEMEGRLKHLEQRVSNLRTESEEIWKTLETAEINLLEILNTKDFDCSTNFGDSAILAGTGKELMKLKTDKQEIEEFYISKIREYILGTSRIARLDAKAEFLRSSLTKDGVAPTGMLVMVKTTVPKRKRIGRMNISGQPKLFGGSLEEYLEATNEEIPLIMRSCIRVINLYGLHHQGIFRVSGSQVEISNFREGFERGDDPLADTTDASDINSVCGVLKLYLRELREPLFPIIYFDHFVSLAQLESKQEVVAEIRVFLQNLPRCVVIVMRYLFAFLNHLSEYSDENMMDAYNLAICFGPTLMPAPEDKDQVQYQNQVNELIKNMIVYHEELFPKDLGGTQYEKYISHEPYIDIEVGDSPTEQVTEDPDSEVYPSEDESDTLEATVQFDFSARSNRELSLKKGETVILRKQVSNDWWQGTVNGKEGLVPDKYISLKIKDEDRDRGSDNMKSSSSEESVRKRRPSGSMGMPSQLSVFSTAAAAAAPALVVPKLVVSTVIDTEPPVEEAKIANQQIGIPIPEPKNDFLQYDSVDAVKNKYSYHEEPHSFENSMDFLEDFNHFQFEGDKKSEPIYAEPSKPAIPVNPMPSTSGAQCDVANGEEDVEVRQKAAEDAQMGVRHSDTEVLKRKEDGEMKPPRKLHTKSFSVCEGRVSNMFQHNREMWEKRAELGSQHSLTTPRILSRNRIAPDLVMDLPMTVIHGVEVKREDSRESLEVDGGEVDVSSAERFAAQNQCTLKKNERFAGELPFEGVPGKKEVKLPFQKVEKPKAEVKPQEKEPPEEAVSESGEVSLHITEEAQEESEAAAAAVQKSPIPARNTQKFVSQFADLKLTGGCLNQGGSGSSEGASGSGNPPALSSFKPVKPVKPQFLKKTLLLPPTTPEMARRAQPEWKHHSETHYTKQKYSLLVESGRVLALTHRKNP
ncbi:SLIT-ROBO Rho GTPase-activating protein 1-like isoform X2 [Phlebotomus argentipes]|uniref:SLIT-ROBO Rho GTPase-activating protein 1-like isoform X2 n=1 Tax=Phlebotomus argentipes TaxID=94469 RepID=UPI0028934556|nr:SLIT-ROBO Rho GTPase-activating protein 1-like isoform X2 [Phlebotomus argentipes]XP_059608915.1 SLIT-ROBO Rho GTPase-activating protein 1-like isoform X2 [Phlebotomus argentipes]XP_059608916.1 SLIT-ROBO Rho GTPase-activating protein 1-like isoform X2 [Phlebotomus argentipes]XP_059608917.1 SLIT-ROBO Rho GTPase-activating protein 1-like isoform X2 [Phlebotomus argentipes]XP_059608918.1 SLIT-ROBO Rho GTPase-activating protein 1-like isoform X2 [Phlebotomus argentipes]